MIIPNKHARTILIIIYHINHFFPFDSSNRSHEHFNQTNRNIEQKKLLFKIIATAHRHSRKLYFTAESNFKPNQRRRICRRLIKLPKRFKIRYRFCRYQNM